MTGTCYVFLVAYVSFATSNLTAHESDGVATVCLVLTGVTNVTERAIVLFATPAEMEVPSAVGKSCRITDTNLQNIGHFDCHFFLCWEAAFFLEVKNEL